MLGVSKPARIASSVDLPEPEAPTIATASRAMTSRSISRRMTRSLSPLFTVLPMPRACRTALLLFWLVSMSVWGVAHAASPLLVFGDSLSAPYGIAEKRGWVSLLVERLKKERLDYRVVNASISGETTSGGRARLAKVLADHKPAVVILELGGNDGLRGLPVPEMKKNLSAMIEQSQKAGARVLLVGTRMPPNYGPEYTQAYEAVFADLAKSHKVALAPDLTAGIGERLELFLPDRVHSNESAQPALLDTVWKALRPLLK